MLTKEENEFLTRVGPGTPAGELLRRYWLPVGYPCELTDDNPTHFVRILGEDLVLYRNTKGGFGLVAEQCSHRGASLYYGFLEEDGIRCPYHGWLYDSAGRCVEQPFEPQQSLLKHTIRHPAYPVQQLGGLLFGEGAGDGAPLLKADDGDAAVHLEVERLAPEGCYEERESRGDAKAGAPRPYGVKEQGHCELATVTGA